MVWLQALTGCSHTRESLQSQHQRRSPNQNEDVFSVFVIQQSAIRAIRVRKKTLCNSASLCEDINLICLDG